MLPNFRFLILVGLIVNAARAQAPEAPAKPTEHVLGTITQADPAAHTITVKDDKTGAETTILLADTKTLLKVPPGAKDLKTATRIKAEELSAGDRVDVRGSKPATDPEKIAARSVVLMSGQELKAVHQAQVAEWRNATAGTVSALDAGAQKITVKQRTPGVPPLVVAVTPQTEFTRYSPATPKTPAASSFAAIQPGDQVRIIGEGAAEGGTITAKRIYSGAFRTVTGTVVSLGGDGKELVIKDLASNKPLTITLNENSTVRKVPPEMAARLAQRTAAGSSGMGGGTGPNSSGSGASGPSGSAAGGSGPGAPVGSDIGRPGMGGMGGRSRDMSQMIERLPQISLSELKAGDAVVVAGAVAGPNNDQLVATQVIAGVEAILRSAPASQQRGQSLGGDWGLSEMSVPQ